jgi:hypothetical protein
MTLSDRREFLLAGSAGLAATWLVPALARARPVTQDSVLSLALIGAGRQGRAMLGELATIPGCSVDAAFWTMHTWTFTQNNPTQKC